MNGGCFENGGLAGKQRMFAARLGECDAPAEPKLAAAGVGAHFTAGGGHGDLQSPAAAEERHAGGEHGPGKFDLLGHGRSAVVDIERGARHGRAVVVLESDPCGQARFGIGGEKDVDLQRCVDVAQHARVALSRIVAERGPLPVANRGDVAVDHQDSRAHAALPTASSLPATAARKMFSNCAASIGMGLPPADGSIAASRR